MVLDLYSIFLSLCHCVDPSNINLHCGTLKMSKAPRNLGSACQIFFWPKSLLMGIYMWEKVKKVFPFNVPGLQDPRRELL